MVLEVGRINNHEQVTIIQSNEKLKTRKDEKFWKSLEAFSVTRQKFIVLAWLKHRIQSRTIKVERFCLLGGKFSVWLFMSINTQRVPSLTFNIRIFVSTSRFVNALSLDIAFIPLPVSNSLLFCCFRFYRPSRLYLNLFRLLAKANKFFPFDAVDYCESIYGIKTYFRRLLHGIFNSTRGGKAKTQILLRCFRPRTLCVCSRECYWHTVKFPKTWIVSLQHFLKFKIKTFNSSECRGFN